MNPEQPCPFPREPIHPDLLAWARQTFNEEEYIAHFREMVANGGGVPLDSFIDEIEALVRGQ